MPNTPLNAAGMRIEPPPSVPIEIGLVPVATAADAPPLEPPAVFVVSQGLRVTPVSGLSVTPFQPSSGVVVLPTSTALCSRSRATAGASTSHACFGLDRVRAAQGRPAAAEQDVLDGHRDAVEQAVLLAGAPPLLRRRRVGERPFGIDEAVRVHRVVDRG